MWGTEGWGLVALGGFMAFIANIFYMWGGTEGFGKWWRRFIGASVLATAANLLAILTGAWLWQYLLFYPCLMIGFSLGYGGDTLTIRLLRRTVYALGVLSTCLIGAWGAGFLVASLIVVALAGLTGATSIALGVLNPFKSARVEEFMVSQVLTLYVPFWAYVARG
jgi:hypothetical protein